MEENDNIIQQFKSAAEEAEQSMPFPGMDAIWQKVAQRLEEEKAEKKPVIIAWYKRVNRMTIAAAMTGAAVLGFYIYSKNNSSTNIESRIVNNLNNRHSEAISINNSVVSEDEPKIAQQIFNLSPGKKMERPALLPKVSIKEWGESVQSIGVNVDVAKNDHNTSQITLTPTVATSGIPDPVLNKPMIRLQGKLIDAQGAVVIGARIRAIGQQVVAFSDVNGNYTIDISDSVKGLVITAPALATDTFWVDNADNHYAYSRLKKETSNVTMAKTINNSRSFNQEQYIAARVLSNTEKITQQAQSPEYALQYQYQNSSDGTLPTFQYLPPAPAYVYQPSTQGAVKQLDNKLAAPMPSQDSVTVGAERKPVIPLQPLRTDDGLIKIKKQNK